MVNIDVRSKWLYNNPLRIMNSRYNTLNWNIDFWHEFVILTGCTTILTYTRVAMDLDIDFWFLMDFFILHWVPSVNSKSFIFGSDFVLFSQKLMHSDSNMKWLLFTESTHYHYIYYVKNVTRAIKWWNETVLWFMIKKEKIILFIYLCYIFILRYILFVWLVGWLVGWLVVCLFGWLFVCLLVCLFVCTIISVLFFSYK